MHSKRITIISWIIALFSVGIALWLLTYFLFPRIHKSPWAFPNSVWECEYNGATITLLVEENRNMRGYIDEDGDRTYLAYASDSITQFMAFVVITEEEFYAGTHGLAAANIMFDGHFRCTNKQLTIRDGVPSDWAIDFWQSEGPIELVFYRVSG